MNLKLLSKRPLYFLAYYFANKFSKYTRHVDAIIQEKEEKHWETMFGKQDNFLFKIDNDLQINLYKDSMLSKMIYKGFEKEELEFVKSVLNEGDVFIDVGANIGLYTLIASRRVGNTGKVISFEPSPVSFKRLNENIVLNNLENTDSRNIGLSNQIGTLKFHMSNNGYDAWDSFAYTSATDKSLKNIDVPVSTLDSEISGIEKEKIKLIKIDVEGWEKFVLNGAKDILTQYAPLLMIEFTEENTFNAGYSVHEIYDIMKDWGYQWYRIKDGVLVNEVKQLYYPYDNLIAKKLL
jgi:FkbM family methyltransferase